MSQQLTLEISDEVYADLQRKANAVGISITEWIVTVLNRQGVVASAESGRTVCFSRARAGYTLV
jgi:hypothetical protein